ncbi:MAG TPA: DUF2934 domain-containing protein [Vicinamibacterales bacterium]|nr:DUF2934 domain-containing protein [Vicinamibacterales bacterium]
MAKRTIRKTDAENTTAPSRRRAASDRSAAEAPDTRTTRRRRSDGSRTKPAVETASAGAAEVANTTGRIADTSVPSQSHEAPIEIPHDYIAVRAYHIYLERGGRDGDSFQDWITAERELREMAAANQLR